MWLRLGGALQPVTPNTSDPHSGSVWSSYRKSCVDMVMKWLVPESSGRYVNRMTNEALHKGRLVQPLWCGGDGGKQGSTFVCLFLAGCSLKVLADSERYTWIVL